MSKLSIGLVTSPSEECKQMAQLLKDAGLEIRYHISPEKIQSQHIEDAQLNVWLLSVNDDDWHDNIDQLLDESDASIYFNEPGTLGEQSHPEYWCKSLISRLYEITGIEENDAKTISTEQTSEVITETEPGASEDLNVSEKQVEQPISEPLEELGSALDELESSSIDLPSDVAADLVSELESISPDLNTELAQQLVENDLSLDDASLETPTEKDFLSELVAERAAESSSAGEFNDIDFSNTQIPMLESAKGGIDKGLKSNYELSDDLSDADLEEQRENDGLELDKILNSPEPDTSLESKVQISSDDLIGGLELEMFSEPEEEQIETEQSFERANFLTEDESETDQIAETDESISDESGASPDLIGLALESIEPEKITGKSSFIEEEEQEEAERVIPELSEQVDEGLDGLTLESNEVETPTGKAVFIEEEPEPKQDKEQDSAELNDQSIDDDSDLTLESNGSEAPTGRAVFDDGEPVEETQQDEPKVEIQDQLESLDDGGLTLESDGRRPTDGIAQYLVDDEPDEDLEPAEQVESAAQADVGDEFEIPMLEESVTDLNFDEPEVFQQVESSLTPCWIIGASLGGPAAVKRFFQALPADVDACFVVVQHIEESFLPVMADILSSSSQFKVAVANGSNTMQPGKVYLAPLKGKIVFLQDGSMLVDHSQKWSEPYTPCINDVIASAASVYAEKSGSIIFSGMGEDGLIGCEKMNAAGGAVWAQSVETCANPSMPNAVINANIASVVATPEMLADRLVQTLSEKVYG